MFLVPPVVPQTKVAISSSLKAQKSYTQKRTEKAALPGGEVAPPPSPPVYKCCIKDGTKAWGIFKPLPERSSPAENKLSIPAFPEKEGKTAMGLLPWQ